MYIVRKKHIIKIASFFCAFLLVLAGIFLYDRHWEEIAEEQRIAVERTLSINLCALTGSIRSDLQKLTETDDTSLSREIYASSHSAKALILYSTSNDKNAASFFSDLADYSSTGMNDTQKNLEYLSAIEQAEKKLINLCSDTTDGYDLSGIFPSQPSSPSGSTTDNAEQFPLLNNRLNADRGEISDFARQILETPISPKQISGIPKLPKAICYSHQSSYAEIFPAGKTLNKMALVSPHTTTAVSQLNIFDAAKHWLTIYAPLANDCKEVISDKTNGAYYFIFCPVITVEDSSFYLYGEKIKLAVSTSDNSLKAFDSSEFLQNHGAVAPTPLKIGLPPKKIPSGSTVVSQRNVLTNRSAYLESAFTVDGLNLLYSTLFADGRETVYTQKEYFRHLSND